MNIDYIEVPSTERDDSNRNHSAWRNGKIVQLDLGRKVQVYLSHKSEKIQDENGEKTITRAFCVEVGKPATRGRIINAAEMMVYRLFTPLDVASFAASLSRKFRDDPNNEEVKEHDDFIAWVKRELDAIGIGTTDAPENRETPVYSLYDLTESTINKTGLSDKDALKFKKFYPEWKVNIDVVKKEHYQYGDDLWEVLQDHKTQEDWKPSLETASLWKRVDESHSGTEDDPIPYAPPMELFEGKYYLQDEVIYKCTRSSGIPLSHNLVDLVGLYVEKF